MDGSFFDVRTHDFARVAVVVPEIRLGDPMANARLHVEGLRKVYEEGAQYAVCPELGITGYSMGDLFFQDVLLKGALRALEELAEATREWDLLFSVGLPLTVAGSLYNCAVTLCRGKVVSVAPKSYPPNYREFYELRWFQPGGDAGESEVTLLGERVPLGTDVIVRPGWMPGFALHVDICEDIWVPIPPGTIAS
jgi:NAD+ synthase (glutamine-hydrolysing)